VVTGCDIPMSKQQRTSNIKYAHTALLGWMTLGPTLAVPPTGGSGRMSQHLDAAHTAHSPEHSKR
jgi:hypothetical protein